MFPPGPTPPPPTAAARQAVFAGLELTPAQRAQLGAITARGRAERAAVTAGKPHGARLTPAEGEALQRSAAAQRVAFDAVLTPAQRARLAANLAAVLAQPPGAAQPPDAAQAAPTAAGSLTTTSGSGPTTGREP